MGSNLPISIVLMCLAAVLTPPAHADIYKCKDEHGNVAYLQTPCPVQKRDETPATDDEIARPDSAARDAEMRKAFSSEQSAAYKESLLALTRQLRGCG